MQPPQEDSGMVDYDVSDGGADDVTDGRHMQPLISVLNKS